jgi:predicted ArsR family transcriptional regulator
MRANSSDLARQGGKAAASVPQRGVGLADIRAANRACILTTLAREGPLSRIALARLVGLSRTTVGSIVADLLREGRLSEAGTQPATVSGGRRAVLLLLNTERASQE